MSELVDGNLHRGRAPAASPASSRCRLEGRTCRRSSETRPGPASGWVGPQRGAEVRRGDPVGLHPESGHNTERERESANTGERCRIGSKNVSLLGDQQGQIHAGLPTAGWRHKTDGSDL